MKTASLLWQCWKAGGWRAGADLMIRKSRFGILHFQIFVGEPIDRLGLHNLLVLQQGQFNMQDAESSLFHDSSNIFANDSFHRSRSTSAPATSQGTWVFKISSSARDLLSEYMVCNFFFDLSLILASLLRVPTSLQFSALVDRNPGMETIADEGSRSLVNI